MADLDETGEDGTQWRAVRQADDDDLYLPCLFERFDT